LRGSRYHYIGALLQQPDPKTGSHKGEGIERASQDSSVLRNEGFHTEYTNAIDGLDLIPAVAIPCIDFPFREIGGTGDDSDPMSPAYPVADVFIDPTGRDVPFWWEIIGEKKNMHA
jgi:hypothetical protein